jgi:chorismate dehydratase
MGRLRISAISYLNTAPLMWDFEHGSVGSDFQISYTIPSACAESLRLGTADIGIIPTAAYAAIPELVILPGIAIASRRPVRSILLVSKVPVEQMRSIALDASSMTSVALLKVILAKWVGGEHVFSSLRPELAYMLRDHDAGLLIGDPALKVDRARYYCYDLAEEWIRHTGKPFVFAFWAVRRAALQEASAKLDLAAIFQESRDHGLGKIDDIARAWGPKLGLSEPEVRKYLTENIYYYLDSDCLDGLLLFYRYAAECRVLPPVLALQFYEALKPAVR